MMWLVFLVVSPDPNTMNHFISITDTPVTQEIPKVFQAVYQELGTKCRYILYYSTIYRFAFSEIFICMELYSIYSFISDLFHLACF